MSSGLAVLVIVVAALGFTAAGVLYSRGRSGRLEEHVTARGTVGASAAAMTLVASGMGAWILFGPAEAATRGGLPSILGYALGAAAPLLVFIPLGLRLRRMMPEGHSLTEYVRHRYGRGMHLLTLLVIVFYMFIFLSAEVTGLTLVASLIADVPLWLTALVVVSATLLYTAYGGLRASVFTDKVQTLIILPLLALIVVAGYLVVGGVGPPAEGLAERAPEIAGWGNFAGLEAGLTFLIAILVANLFHQGYWQRVYAIQSPAALRRGFLIAAVIVLPLVFAMGLFGLAAVGLGAAETPSIAFFSVLLGALPLWAVVALLVVGLALVMSSADTLLNGIASIVAVDLKRAIPEASARYLLAASRLSTLVLAVPLVLIASQGYSVLYLLLLADLVCAAAVFPVFFGLYSERFTARAAVSGTLAGLAAGALLFPGPAMTSGSLLGSFLVALGVSTAVALALTPWRSRAAAYDLGSLKEGARYLPD